MAKLIKCKICGDTEFAEVGELLQCRSCKHKTPKPKENAELLERANNLRFETKSFDEAANLYEEIIRITPDEAEAYWGRVLCRYGIEYVKDNDGRYLPTCHRTLEGSILDDGDYKMAVMKAQRGMSEYYMSEAQTIDEYQKKIKIIAAKEDPYDVFISFKATDEYGRTTEDSLLAQELYYYLTKNLGLKVFFSNITLKDKAGQEYEPIIYAALSSATVMVLVGTKPEYVNATWVKNEWSRYVKMVAAAKTQNKSKYIVTALKDMRPEQLPSVLASYQAVNLAELGAKEKLCSNIDSLIGDLRVQSNKATNTGGGFNADDMLSAEAKNLCNLGYQQLATKNFAKASEYFEKAIEKKSDAALAHWGLLLVSQGAANDDELADKRFDIKADPRYKMAMEYATAEERMRFERVDSLVDASLAREASVYCDRGFESLKGRDFEGAEAHFEKALAIKSDMSRAHWGMLLVVEEACDDEELSSFVGAVEESEYFKAAMSCATSAEKERYNNVVEKMRAAGLAKADEFLASADELLQSDSGAKHKQAKNNILLAIWLKGGDIPAKYYWAWLRTFLGAANDEMLEQVAYPVKDDIFYKRAMERANSQEAARYERIAERCHKLYNCRLQNKYHCMTLNSSLSSYSFGWVPGKREEFVSYMSGEVAVSETTGYGEYNILGLDEYMVKYIAGIIPDPRIRVADTDEFSRYKYIATETVSVYLHNDADSASLYSVRNSMKEHLGLSEEKANDILSNAPCYIAHDLPIEKANEFCKACLGKFGNANVIVRMHAKPLNNIISEYNEPSVNPNERVSVYLTQSRDNHAKETIRFLHDKCGIDKRTAKDAVKNTSGSLSYRRIPICVAANIPLSQANELLDEIYHKLYAKAEIRWQ